MSEDTNRRSTPALPELVVSKPIRETEKESLKANVASRRRKAPLPVLKSKEHGRSQSSEWIDVDESPERTRKTKRRSSQRHGRRSRTSSPSQALQHSPQRGQVSTFRPRLSGILEASESISSSRPGKKSSENRRHRDQSPMRRSRQRDDPSSGYHRPSQHRTGGVQRRSESLLKVNPSLLSVLSTLTGNSDRSSGSNSTITQRSYDMRNSMPPSNTSSKSRRALSYIDSNVPRLAESKPTNVFDYMHANKRQDAQSVISSSSSQDEPSDGSSEAPGTPSSRSTFPSPTDSRSQGVVELRRRHDSQYGTGTNSVAGASHSPTTSAQSLQKQPSVSDVPEDEEDILLPHQSLAERSYEPQRSSSRSSRASRSSRRDSDRLQQQEDSMRQHVAYTQQQHSVEPVYGQHRSNSYSSAYSDRSADPYHMAMQQYHWPQTQTAGPPAPPQTMNGHITPHEIPPAPEPPDLTQRTLTGYEMLALELTASDSPVKPLYRKFEYLNHRVLLHLQDELSELEEQLRMLDEAIAQIDPGQATGQKTPASRRGEAFHGGDIHYRRTHLLGRIFMKTEQYNKAMSAYASMAKDSSTPESDEVANYQQWMSKNAPVHEVETRFLQKQQDLVVPGKSSASSKQPTTIYSAMPYLPVALILPILLYSIVPSLVGRLIITTLITVGVFLVAATTSIRQLMTGREWAICGAVYVLLMAAIAGCIPHHTT